MWVGIYPLKESQAACLNAEKYCLSSFVKSFKKKKKEPFLDLIFFFFKAIRFVTVED